MRREEQFAGLALLSHLGDPPDLRVLDGEDPPDLYLRLSDSTRVAVEVTRLMQPIANADGSLGNRTSHDQYGVDLIEKLNSELGPQVPDSISLIIVLHLPADDGRLFKRGVTACVNEVLRNPIPGIEIDRVIQGAKVSVSVVSEDRAVKKVRGIVANRHSSPDILLNAQYALEERIRTKDVICRRLPASDRVWLALLNDYWLADADTYRMAIGALTLQHCFERIFLVSGGAQVTELYGDNHSGCSQNDRGRSRYQSERR